MAENCDYSDTAVKSKNCYYSFGTFYCEDVYYARYSRKCTDCNGLTLCAECEWCTECVDCVKCYSADYCSNCNNCTSTAFCHDCFGCSDCFGCVGLHQKKYHFFNQPLEQSEYEKRRQELNLQDANHRALVMQKIEELRKAKPNLGIHQFQTEDCIGDHMTESKNCVYCFDVFASEDCYYNVEANANNNCCDLTVCFETEWSYQCIQSPLCYGCNFLMHMDNSKNCEFCAYGRNLRNCFGCVYLADKEYHILNQPVDLEKYEEQVARIKRELIENGQYNLGLYFVSDYETTRLQSETEPAISASFPAL